MISSSNLSVWCPIVLSGDFLPLFDMFGRPSRALKFLFEARRSVAEADGDPLVAQYQNVAVRVSNSLCSVVSDCINTTGISGLGLLQQVRVFPNPVANRLHLTHLPTGTEVAVYDVLGRIVYKGLAQKVELKINTAKWAPGLYLVALRNEGTQQLVKIVKGN